MRASISVSLPARMDHTRSSPLEGRGRVREDPMDADARMSPGPEGPQHLQALQRANAVRLARAELKRRVADGDITAADVILCSPWEAESMTVSDLLTSQRRWGSTRCRKLLQYLSIPENKTIGSMTDRQRRVLAALLSEPERTCRPAATAAEHDRSESLRPVLAGVA
jgi:hypothetical protein